MITRLEVDNFKSLNDFSIDFEPLTVLIGENATGKSTVLQAVDFLVSSLKEDFGKFIEGRGWTPQEVKSKLSRKQNVSFALEFLIDGEKFRWELIIALRKGEFVVLREAFTNVDAEKPLLEFDGEYLVFDNHNAKVPPVSYVQPFLGSIGNPKKNWLEGVKGALAQIQVFDLLSTDRMRKQSRGQQQSIGRGGEMLATYFHNLDRKKKEEAVARLRKFLQFIERVATKRKKGAFGYTSISIEEAFTGNGAGSKTIRVPAEYISDGTLRILAIVAMTLAENEGGTLLLDEIENGINPYLAGLLVQLLENTVNDQQCQFIVTTHSPLILNYVPHESIIYMLRHPDGRIEARKIFEREQLRDMLEYMNPGEIWVSLDREELLYSGSTEKMQMLKATRSQQPRPGMY